MLTSSQRIAAKILGARPELVLNGDFTTDTTSWQSTVATLSVVGQELVITATSGVSGGAYQVIPTVAGRSYRVRATVRNGTAASTLFRLSNGTQVGGTGDILSTAGPTIDQTFTALGATTTVYVRIGATGAGVNGFADSISVK